MYNNMSNFLRKISKGFSEEEAEAIRELGLLLKFITALSVPNWN